MKTTFDLENIIWNALKDSVLLADISGDLYKQRRPSGSTSEDVVIISLPVNNLELQSAIINVNIHVPNLSIKPGGVQDNSQPNHPRLNELTKLAIEALQDQWAEDYNFDVVQQTIFQDSDGSHYVNIRLDFYSINILN